MCVFYYFIKGMLLVAEWKKQKFHFPSDKYLLRRVQIMSFGLTSLYFEHESKWMEVCMFDMKCLLQPNSKVA